MTVDTSKVHPEFDDDNIKRKIRKLKQSRKTVIGNCDFQDYIPDLTMMHITSFNDFIQWNENDRKNQGLEKVLRRFFPIIHKKTNLQIDYLEYTIQKPKISEDDCISRGLNYAGTLKIHLKVTNLTTLQNIDFWCSFGELPIITNKGTFIINGHSRIFISQMQRAPGVLFHNTDQKYGATAKLYPRYGSWLQFAYDKNSITLSIDKKKSMSIIAFLLLFCKDNDNKKEQLFNGYDLSEILLSFYKTQDVIFRAGKYYTTFDKSKYNKTPLPFDICNADGILVPKGEFITEESPAFNMNITETELTSFNNLYCGEDIMDLQNPQLIAIEIGEKITSKNAHLLPNEFKIFTINDDCIPQILHTHSLHSCSTKLQAIDILKTTLRLGPHVKESHAQMMFNTKFGDEKLYNFESVGRRRLNNVFKENHSDTEVCLRFSDPINVIKILPEIADGRRPSDQIDSLSHKMCINCGHILEKGFTSGLIRFEKDVQDRLQSFDISNPSPSKISDIFNFRHILQSVINGFYTHAHLLDDTNHSTITTSLRKTSASISNDTNRRTIVEIRVANYSEYGRICIVQTPEGLNVGIIKSLALMTKIDKDGFLLAPYFEVKNGIAKKEVVYITAYQETGKVIASKDDFIDCGDHFTPKDNILLATKDGQTGFYDIDSINYINIANNQIFSTGSSLTPFPGYSDPYRVLVAANMNSQAVPLLKSQPPFIGTGMEKVLSHTVKADNDGRVVYVAAFRVILETQETVEIKYLEQNKKTNKDTCINYKPLVKVDDLVKAGDILANGFTTTDGELSLGTNLLVVYKSDPYCYEDAYVINERLVYEDVLSSIYLNCLTCEIYETRGGAQMHTRDIAAPSELLAKLDEDGIIKVGEVVKGGDILVGKISPTYKDNTHAPENQLLHAIFGTKVPEFQDNSLRLPHGQTGVVIKVEIIARSRTSKDSRLQIQDIHKQDNIMRECDEKKSIFRSIFIKKLQYIFSTSKLLTDFYGFKKGEHFILHHDTENFLFVEETPINNINQVKLILENYKDQIAILEQDRNQQIQSLNSGYELPDGCLKLIKVHIAINAKIEVGDKLCGRYANKGVISQIRSRADMPYLEDGRPVDVIISPIGIVARMNLGQIYETILGHAIDQLIKQLHEGLKKNYSRDKIIPLVELAIGSSELEKLEINLNEIPDKYFINICQSIIKHGVKWQIPQFQDLPIEKIAEILQQVNTSASGKVNVYDGITGEKFEAKCLVGYQYILKLVHMAWLKMHSRALGPRNIITSQPVGGKQRGGGQRVGEMEVWAMNGHGAAYTSLESLGFKSDENTQSAEVWRQLTSGRPIILNKLIDKQQNKLSASFNRLIDTFKATNIEVTTEYKERELCQ